MAQRGQDLWQWLAMSMGCNYSTVRHCEYGLRTPSLETIGRLADALGVEYAVLIARAEVSA